MLLGLVSNALVRRNTRHLQRALAGHWATEGAPKLSDVARPSPLPHKHVNTLGRYDFTRPERVAAGEFRPLRNPASYRRQLAGFT